MMLALSAIRHPEHIRATASERVTAMGETASKPRLAANTHNVIKRLKVRISAVSHIEIVQNVIQAVSDLRNVAIRVNSGRVLTTHPRVRAV